MFEGIVEGKTFENLDLKSKTISDVTFRNVTFKNCEFECSEFRNVVFENVKFIDSTFAGASFEDVVFDNVTFSYPSDLSDTLRKRVKFRNVKADYVDFSGAEFYDVEFNNVSLLSSDLSETKMYNVKIDNSTMNYADLSKLYAHNLEIHNTYLIRADFTYSSLKGAKIIACELERANLSHSDISGACLDYSNLFGTFMKDANVTDVSLYRTELRASELRYAKGVESLKMVIQERRGEYDKAREVYSQLKEYFASIGNIRLRNYFHYKEHKMALKCEKGLSKFRLYLSYYTTGFGVKPLRLLFLMLLVILSFSLIYSAAMPIRDAISISISYFFNLKRAEFFPDVLHLLGILESILGQLITALLIALISKYEAFEI